jgi:ABC-type branched-subunit amino acid transport system ATPase component
MPTPIIDVRNLTKKFGGVTALDKVSLSIEPGHISGLIGPNGAGKSTFFNVLTGVLASNGGEIRYDDRSMDGIPPHARVRLGMVRTFQKIHPFYGMTVLESVMVGCHTKSSAGLLGAMLRPAWVKEEERRIRDAARSALAFVGLEAQAGTLANALPIGHQRMLQLACALVTEPRVLLLDEPASGLNASETARLAGLLLAIREQGKTLVLVEHDMGLVMKICDQITVLSFGRKLAGGAPQEVRRNPEVIKAYLGSGERSA